ncbi:actin-like ATPase domain-containing protein [Artomyces pyxidatus]|uniref:Actin-like ATPase domain-containing protein n=1 Tax=Artomyces pyxidatus TaxID=48021 RepID=A0ACB8T9A1_9AGAM|nr:actin-like ATPase domain-containing protein [Artomyces pyxidatus]
MPAAAKGAQALFLGLELATDQLRATIVDENLELVGVEAVDFDTELSEYQTQGGIFTTPGDAYTTPVDMWVKALDFLLEKVSRNHDISRIKSIGGAAQPALVWWKSTPIPSFPPLDSRLPLHSQLSPNTFSLPNTPVAQDTFSHSHALSLEAALGGPDHMAARVGTSANSSLVAAQLLRVREASPDTWARTGRVQVASAFLASLVAGSWVGMSEAEACATGMWVYASGGQGHWDEEVIELVAGSREDARRVRAWLGEVDMSGGGRRIATVSRYLVDRYGFEPDTIISSFTADYLSNYLSVCPSPSDAVLSFGPMDFLLTSAPHYLPTRLYNVFPHPAQDLSEKRRYIVMLTSRNADVPRALVRDMYTKSWSAFDRLVSVVPPGGSIGLDDKLFSFWLLQGDSYPLSHVKGIFRFETGIKVNEFRDLRANPRCLVESQALSFRVRWARMAATGVLGAAAGRARGSSSFVPSTSTTASPGPGQQRTSTPSSVATTPGAAPAAAASIGLTFDPYDYSALPARLLTTGAAINFPSVASLISELFNAPVFVPTTQLDSAQVTPHRNAPAPGFPGRAALGGAYVARWVWGKERGSVRGSFEEEIRRLLGKRWVSTGGTPLRTNINAPTPVSSGQSAGSGASTPYGSRRSGFGTTVFAEEDEDALEELERLGGDAFGEGELVGRLRTITGSTTGSTATAATSSTGSGVMLPSTAYTTPDLGAPTSTSPGAGENGSTVAGAPATLAPVTALPTGEAEMQIGLGKVAEPDVDAFMAYAAIVPEYCRLEGMLVKALV